MRIRPATANDIPDCVILRGLTSENAISPEQLAAMGITVESWSCEVTSGSLPGFVCVCEDSIVGYCFGNKATGEVVVLALLPAYEAKGLGKQLLDFVINLLVEAGHRRLFLACASDPAVRSHGFYRHLGWASSGTFDLSGDEILELFPRRENEV